MQVVSISGPPASGKTTLWHALRAELTDVAEFVPDLPRQALEVLGPAAGADDAAGFQHYVGYAQLIAESRPPANGARLRICDKSMIDALAYWDVLVDAHRRPAWSASVERQDYALTILCQHEPGMHPIGELQWLHADARDALAQRIRTLAAGRRDVISLTGPPHARLTAAIEALARAGVLPSTFR